MNDLPSRRALRHFDNRPEKIDNRPKKITAMSNPGSAERQVTVTP
jgi:hypothetical protein